MAEFIVQLSGEEMVLIRRALQHVGAIQPNFLNEYATLSDIIAEALNQTGPAFLSVAEDIPAGIAA